MNRAMSTYVAAESSLEVRSTRCEPSTHESCDEIPRIVISQPRCESHALYYLQSFNLHNGRSSAATDRHPQPVVAALTYGPGLCAGVRFMSRKSNRKQDVRGWISRPHCLDHYRSAGDSQLSSNLQLKLPSGRRRRVGPRSAPCRDFRTHPTEPPLEAETPGAVTPLFYPVTTVTPFSWNCSAAVSMVNPEPKCGPAADVVHPGDPLRVGPGGDDRLRPRVEIIQELVQVGAERVQHRLQIQNGVIRDFFSNGVALRRAPHSAVQPHDPANRRRRG
jgi:hypothetical protein